MMTRTLVLSAVLVTAGMAVAVYLISPKETNVNQAISETVQQSQTLPQLKPQREAALPPSQADITEVIAETMREQEAKLPTFETEFMAEPVDTHFAEETEPQIWAKVSKLEGVQSAEVQCRTYHCQVVVRSSTKPAIALEVPGLTFRGNQDGGLRFLYNPDLAGSE